MRTGRFHSVALDLLAPTRSKREEGGSIYDQIEAWECDGTDRRRLGRKRNGERARKRKRRHSGGATIMKEV